MKDADSLNVRASRSQLQVAENWLTFFLRCVVPLKCEFPPGLARSRSGARAGLNLKKGVYTSAWCSHLSKECHLPTKCACGERHWLTASAPERNGYCRTRVFGSHYCGTRAGVEAHRGDVIAPSYQLGRTPRKSLPVTPRELCATHLLPLSL